jgi:hypothetical protein
VIIVPLLLVKDAGRSSWFQGGGEKTPGTLDGAFILYKETKKKKKKKRRKKKKNLRRKDGTCRPERRGRAERGAA